MSAEGRQPDPDSPVPESPVPESPDTESPGTEPPETESKRRGRRRGKDKGRGATLMQRVLNFIERVGNKVPHPAIMFIALCVGIIILSQILAWIGVSATYQVVTPPPVTVQEYDVGGSTYPEYVLPPERVDAEDYEVVTRTVEIKSLLDGDGIRFLFTSFIANFMSFTAMGIILIVMIGVGLSESSGLIGALIRKLVAVSSPASLTYIIVFIGIISSIASDAGYLVLIPLGAAAFMSVGRHPLAGMAAAFAGVAAGFGVNFLITPTDAVLTEIAN
jgi:aminobenzoyl-glutamate transport protein